MRSGVFAVALLLSFSMAQSGGGSELTVNDCMVSLPAGTVGKSVALESGDILGLLKSADPAKRGSAMAALGQAAASNQPWALRQLSAMYAAGTGVAQRPDCARQLLTAAAEAGDVASQVDLATELLSGAPAKVDVAKAQLLLEQAGTSDDAWTLINIANIYKSGKGMPVDAGKAVALYERAAALHNDAALVQLGSLYRAGLGDVPADATKAADYFTQAVAAGNNAARVNLALMLMQGTTPADNQKAVALLGDAVADKDVWATTLLAGLYIDGRLVPADGKMVIKLLQPLADAGNAAAIAGLGDLYRQGAGTVPADPAQAQSFYERAASLKDLGAKNKLGLMLIDTKGPNPDVARGVSLLEQVADAGDGWANMQVGDLYATGGIVAADPAKALARYTKAVALGVPAGLVRISGIYENGLGTFKADHVKATDYLEQAVALGDNTGRVMLAIELLAQSKPDQTARGLDLLQQAAATGDAWASTLLASYYVDGTKIAADGDKVIALLQPLADKHQAAAMSGLGDLYRKGAGKVAADPKKALALYEQAAELGDIGAKNKLGLMLVDPASPAPDAPRGVALLKEVAEHGDGWAMIQTGDALTSGQGLPIDAEAAAGYYQRAAKAGISAGYLRLGSLYAKGLGSVAADPKSARGYFEKAIAQNDDTARIYLAQMLQASAKNADREQAEKLLGDAAGNDSVWALTILADLYGYGRGREPDYGLAMQSFNRLQALGQDAAKLQMGLALATGPLAKAHSAEGIALIRQAVAAKVPNAIAELARLQAAGKVRGDDGRDAERSLLAEVKAGNGTALRYLLQLYRSGGTNFAPQLVQAQKLLDANRNLLKPEDVAFESISLAAMRPATQANMGLIASNFSRLRSTDISQVLQVLFWSNKNAYVYIVQQRIKQQGQYSGSVSGTLTKQTITAIKLICQKVATPTQCSQGPLVPSNVVALADYFAAS